jgi:uncharacterized protein (DUF2062 family)
MKKLNKNSLRYLYFKLVKQQGPPDSIARGVAIGFFVGFLIPIGGQMALALALAYLFQAKKIPAMACTWVTNYLTVPFIYPIQCYVGSVLMGNKLTFEHIQNIFNKFFKDPSLSGLFNLGIDIFVPFLVGGALFGIVSAFFGYFAAYGMIVRYRQRSDRRLRMKLSASTKKDAFESSAGQNNG